MFETLLKPFTTATAGGTVFRDAFIAVGIILSMLGTIGWLDAEQVIALQKAVEDLSGQLPALLIMVGSLGSIGMSIYRALYKSSSDKAAEVAKEVDLKMPPASPVFIETPGDLPNIKVEVKPDGSVK